MYQTENERKSVFGIDLGTTYSCIAYIDESGNPQVAQNLDSESTTPSVVNFLGGTDADGHAKVCVGQIAKDSAIIDPDRTVQFVKVLMGKEDVAATIDGKDRTPQEISSYILRKVAQDAEKTTGFSVDDVVVTVPAHFGDKECRATKEAGDMSGLNVLRLIQEPIAAAVYYGCVKDDDQTVLVYDLGGGTFDVTVVNITHEDGVANIRVVCQDGNHNLGGRLWDEALLQHFAEEFRRATDFDGEYDEFAQQAFLGESEKAKKALSKKSEHRVPLTIAGVSTILTIIRDMFESLTSHLLEETMVLTRSVIDNAHKKGYKVGKILLVGGSTYMPQVENALQENFPSIPRALNEPNEAVAKGAALVAANEVRINFETQDGQAQGGDDTPYPLPSSGPLFKFDQVTSKSYGLEIVGSKICNVILKNQLMPEDKPYVREHRFATAGRTDTVTVAVYENDCEDGVVPIAGYESIIVGEFFLGEVFDADTPLDARLSLDHEGILDVLLVNPANEEQFSLRVDTRGLSEEQYKSAKENTMLTDVM